MHPRISEVLAHLDSTRAELASAVAAVPANLQSQKPGPDRWSVAEVIEHLTLVEGRVGQVIMKNIAEARANGLGNETSDDAIVPTVDVAGLLDRSTPRPASDASQPKEGLDAATALDKLNQQRQVLRDAITAADGLALSTVQADHPRLGMLNMYQWIVFLGAHEGRHVGQIRDNVNALSA